jgi:hypothetical protein
MRAGVNRPSLPLKLFQEKAKPKDYPTGLLRDLSIKAATARR